jgi:hypothetical protein
MNSCKSVLTVFLPCSIWKRCRQKLKWQHVHSDLSRSNIGIRQENGRLKTLLYASHQSTERPSSKQHIGLVISVLHTAKTKCQNFETNIPRKGISGEKEYRGLSPNFHIHASVSDLYIYYHDRYTYSAGGNMYTDPWTK